MIPSERGTPPATVHSTPVPAQVMHSSTLRRLTPGCSLSPMALLPCGWVHGWRPGRRAIYSRASSDLGGIDRMALSGRSRKEPRVPIEVARRIRAALGFVVRRLDDLRGG